jgi:hypothetical protein
MNDPTASSTWLHNMSVPPKTVVKFEGLGALARRKPSGGTGGTTLEYGGIGLFGTPVRFALPADVGRRGLKTTGILRWLEPTAGLRTAKLRTSAARRRHVEALIDQRAASVPLPEGCVVIPSLEAHPVLWSDLLTTLAVLAKCTDTLWLRERPASLVSALERARVSLLVPPAFAEALPDALPDAHPADPEVRHES